MKIKFLIILYLIGGFLKFVSAQEAVIKGVIYDSKTHETLIGVSIVDESGKGVASDIEGKFELKSKSGTNLIKFSYIGYKPLEKSIEVADGETKNIEIKLEPETTVLDGIVVTAGKFEQKLGDITVSMELIKPKIIENTNTTNMLTAIEQVPGVNVVGDNVNIRGGSGYSYGTGSRVLVLVDDMPMLSADVGDAKWNFLPTENISQVEILKGAASALYGSSALNGIINIRTAFPKSEAITKVSFHNGIYLSPKREELKWWGNKTQLFNGSSFFHSRRIDNLDLVASGNLFHDAGYRTFEFEDRIRFNLNLRYRSKKIKGLSYGVNSGIMYQDKSDFFLWENADNAYIQNIDGVNTASGIRMNIDPQIKYFDKKGNKHILQARFFEVTNNIEGENKNSSANFYYSEYQFHKQFVNNLHLSAGLTGNYAESVAELFGNHISSNFAFFSQIDKKYFDRLSLSVGMRWEFFRLDSEAEDSKPIFRTGLNYQIAEYTYLRASYGMGYRFPTIAEKYTSTNLSTVKIFPNPLLNSETGWSSEIGIKQGVKFSNWNGYIDIAAFWSEYQNMMEFTFGFYDTLTYQAIPVDATPAIYNMGFKSINVGNARISGIDMTLTGHGDIWGIPATILAGYTYTNPIDLNATNDSSRTTNSDILKYRFYHSAKADLELRFVMISTGISFVYNSHMINIDKAFEEPLIPFPEGTPQNVIDEFTILPGLKKYREDHDDGNFTFDYRIIYHLSGKTDLGFFIKNIFNAENMSRPGDIAEPRNVSVKLSMLF